MKEVNLPLPPDCPRCGRRMDVLMELISQDRTFYACEDCPPPWRLDSEIDPCDACAFLLAVRECHECGRPLCSDCLRTHICPRLIQPKKRRRPSRR